MPPTRRYTPEQREALLQAVVINGLSVAEAVRRARAGELPGTGAFRIPYQSASTIINKGRDAFAVSAPHRARAALDRAALTVVDHALKAARNLGDEANPAAIKRAADAITAARRALPPELPRPRKHAADATEADAVENGQPQGTLAELLKLAQRLEEPATPPRMAPNGSPPTAPVAAPG